MGTAILEPRTVGDLRGRFFIPSYQRGYRWGEEEVRRLLDDIAEAGRNDYYLQPIVVKATPEPEVWELVDGQQRLTTLYLITRHIERQFTLAAPAYVLEYETRSQSAEYLDTLDPERSEENIDFHHMQVASGTIEKWFNKTDNPLLTAMNIYQALQGNVYVIWYQADAKENSADVFARLNVGRIPLTDAELVKALVLSRVRNINPERAHAIAAEWDSVERDLRAPEAWAFISGTNEEQPSHIQLLLDALAGHDPRAHTPLYDTFERLRPQIAADPEGLWDRVMGLHSRIIGWYEDRATYHRIGFLARGGMSLRQLAELNEGKGRQEFDEALVAAIRKKLDLSEDQLRDLQYGNSRTEMVLFLMNVQTVLGNVHSSERYSFHGHAASRWSLEHIHAQNAVELKTEDQWRTWIDQHLAALRDLPGSASSESADEISSSIPPAGKALRRVDFEHFQREIAEAFERAGQAAEGEVDGLDNLALLSGSANSALSNGYFEVKRKHLIDMDRAGDFIPPCTRNAFLKYYTRAEGQQLHFWSPQDRSDYLDAIVAALNPYLKEGEPTDD